MTHLVQPIRRLAVSLAIAAVSLHQAAAANIKVTNVNDNGNGSLRRAIATAVAGDKIVFTFSNSATIKLTTGQLVIDKDITIVGPGSGALTISGNKLSRVFSVPIGVTASITGVTIADGLVTGAATGAGIYCDNSTLSLNDCVLTRNTAPNGGALALQFATVYAVDSTFAGNTATATGGAIYCSQGSVLMASCSLYNNCAKTLGGAIYNLNGTVDLTNATFSQNTAQYGGAILTDLGTVFAHNVTIAKNTASIRTGGVLNREGATVFLNNTIIACNISPLNPDLAGDDTTAQDSFGGSLIGIGTGSNLVSFGTDDQVGTTAAPINPRLGAIADNGGKTLTMALLPGSPAYNKGLNALAVDGQTLEPLTVDQRGFARIAAGRVDIGAYELLSAKDYKCYALSLIPNHSTGDWKTDANFRNAGCWIEYSLSACFWSDASHLTDWGCAVFVSESYAACYLSKIEACGGPSAALAVRIMEALVEADRLLAQTAITEADPKCISRSKHNAAKNAFAQAECFVAKGKYTEAISTFGIAWKYAQTSRGWNCR